MNVSVRGHGSCLKGIKEIIEQEGEGMTDKEIMQELDDIWVFGEEPTGRQRKAANQAIDLIRELHRFKKLGTVEELKEAKEKQIAKKPICVQKPYSEEVGINEEWNCPNCGAYVGYSTEAMDEPEQMEYCVECGQHIARDWSEI